MDGQSRNIYDRLKAVNNTMISVQNEAGAAELGVDALIYERDIWANKSAATIPGLVFPIAGPFDYPLIDSWGSLGLPGPSTNTGTKALTSSPLKGPHWWPPRMATSTALVWVILAD